jgi:uncharacterized damage-inducible protein DinB
MNTDRAERRLLEELPDFDPVIGPWIWAIEDARRRTKAALASINSAGLDWLPPGGGNSIGTLLYHIAAIELDYLYADVFEGQQPWPAEFEELFRWDVRNGEAHLTAIHGLPMSDYLLRLDLVRRHLLEAYREMSVAEFRRPRRVTSYLVTPEWVLHHLMQHEAEHRGQIELLATLAAQLADH